MLVMLEDFYLKFTHIEVRDRTFKEHYASITDDEEVRAFASALSGPSAIDNLDNSGHVGQHASEHVLQYLRDEVIFLSPLTYKIVKAFETGDPFTVRVSQLVVSAFSPMSRVDGVVDRAVVDDVVTFIESVPVYAPASLCYHLGDGEQAPDDRYPYMCGSTQKPPQFANKDFGLLTWIFFTEYLVRYGWLPVIPTSELPDYLTGSELERVMESPQESEYELTQGIVGVALALASGTYQDFLVDYNEALKTRVAGWR